MNELEEAGLRLKLTATELERDELLNGMKLVDAYITSPPGTGQVKEAYDALEEWWMDNRNNCATTERKETK